MYGTYLLHFSIYLFVASIQEISYFSRSTTCFSKTILVLFSHLHIGLLSGTWHWMVNGHLHALVILLKGAEKGDRTKIIIYFSEINFNPRSSSELWKT
jgi:hypothetical protein